MKTPVYCNDRVPIGTSRQRGFSIVEILIGVAIGLIGIIMMFQLTENWEIRKRTTAAGSDAQSSGSIASYRLTQDVRQAGYGFGTAGTNVGCNVSAYDDDRATKNFTFRMAPVVIVQGTAASPPDQIQVLYGNSTTLSSNHEYTGPTVTEKTATTKGPHIGLQRGDLVIAAPGGGSCGLIQITDNTDADIIKHESGTFTNEEGDAGIPARYNDPAGFLGTLVDPVGALYNLGRSPARNLWRVNGRTLQNCNSLQSACADADWIDVSEGIIDLQAEYGLDTDNDTIVNTWQTAAPANWEQLRAIRVAILARSQHFESTAVTIVLPTAGWLDGANNPVDFDIKDLDGGAPANDDTPDDWRHYRYRVYTTVVPLRNMVWGTMP